MSPFAVPRHRRSSRSFVSPLLVVALLAFSSPVVAQTDDDAQAAKDARAAEDARAALAQARYIVMAGIEAYDAGRIAGAIDLFARAEQLARSAKLEQSPVLALYQARAFSRRGRAVLAAEYYRKALPAEADARPAWRRAAREAKEELPKVEARIAVLTIRIRLEPSPPVQKRATEPEVQLDGEPLPPALVNVAAPIDPGRHRVLAKAEGYLQATGEVSLGEGENSVVVLRLKLDPDWAVPGAAVPPVATATKDPATPAGEVQPAKALPVSDHSTLAYISLGIGVVGVAAGGYFLYQHGQKQDAADSASDACTGNECDPGSKARERIDGLDSDAVTFGNYSIAGFIAGGVGLVAGVTFLLLDGREPSANRAGVRPFVSMGRLGVAGRF